MPMGPTGKGIRGWGRARRPFPLMALAAILAGSVPGSVAAQMFSDRPPPVPPAAVPDALTGTAMNLAPPAGPASIPSLPAPLTQPTIAQPSIQSVPPVTPPQGATTAGQAVLSLTARYGKDLPVINNGLVWRGFAAKPGGRGAVKLVPRGPRAAPHNRLPAPPPFVYD